MTYPPQPDYYPQQHGPYPQPPQGYYPQGYYPQPAQNYYPQGPLPGQNYYPQGPTPGQHAPPPDPPPSDDDAKESDHGSDCGVGCDCDWPGHVKGSYFNTFVMIFTGFLSVVFGASIAKAGPWGVTCFVFFFLGSILLLVGALAFVCLCFKRKSAGWHLIVLMFQNYIVYFSLLAIFACMCCGKGFDDYAYFSNCLPSDFKNLEFNSSSMVPEVYWNQNLDHTVLVASSSSANKAGTGSFISLISNDLGETPLDTTYNHPGVTGYAVVIFLLCLLMSVFSVISCKSWLPSECVSTVLLFSLVFWSFSTLLVYGFMSLVLLNFVDPPTELFPYFGHYACTWIPTAVGFGAFLAIYCVVNTGSEIKNVWKERNQDYPLDKDIYEPEQCVSKCCGKTCVGPIILAVLVVISQTVIIIWFGIEIYRRYTDYKTVMGYDSILDIILSPNTTLLSSPSTTTTNSSSSSSSVITATPSFIIPPPPPLPPLPPSTSPSRPRDLFRNSTSTPPAILDADANAGMHRKRLGSSRQVLDCAYTPEMHVKIFKSYIGLLAINAGPIGLILFVVVVILICVVMCLVQAAPAVGAGAGVGAYAHHAHKVANGDWKCPCGETWHGSKSNCPGCGAEMNYPL